MSAPLKEREQSSLEERPAKRDLRSDPMGLEAIGLASGFEDRRICLKRPACRSLLA
jgi:hypothetical protein